jgi:hypothetical protein
MILYLLAADLVNTAVSAVLCFAERILYPTYAVVPTLWGIAALSDQAAAGAIMWVAGSIAFLLPVGWILTRLLEPSLVTPPIGSAVTARRNGRNARAARAIRLRFVLLPCALGAWHLCQPQPALPHHTGVVQFRQTTGQHTITLFSESTPVYAGLVELGVLVQTTTGEPLLDAEVTIELRHDEREPVRVVARRADASNKLMYGTEAALTPGLWQVAVRVRHEEQSGNVTGKLVVEAARTGRAVWFYLLVAGGAVGVALIAWRQRRSTPSL